MLRSTIVILWSHTLKSEVPLVQVNGIHLMNELPPPCGCHDIRCINPAKTIFSTGHDMSEATHFLLICEVYMCNFSMGKEQTVYGSCHYVC